MQAQTGFFTGMAGMRLTENAIILTATGTLPEITGLQLVQSGSGLGKTERCRPAGLPSAKSIPTARNIQTGIVPTNMELFIKTAG